MSSDLTTSGGGSGLAADGSTAGATSTSQVFTNGLTTAAGTGKVGIGMSPSSMLDITANGAIGVNIINGVGTALAASSSATPAVAGSVSLTGATGAAQSTTINGRNGGAGGAMSHTGGTGGDHPGATASGSRAGAGGAINNTGGNGGAATAVTGSVNGGAGGAINETGGTGGVSSTAVSGKGGSVNISGGTGGASSIAAGTSGAGGDITIAPGTAGAASGGAASGVSGTVSIGTASSTTNILGGQRVQVAAKTANYTATIADNVITVDATAGNVSITLPAASSAFSGSLGSMFRFKRLDGSVNTITIATAGADTIDGAASVTLVTQYSSKDIVALSASTFGVF
jgi:hypothetical protein